MTDRLEGQLDIFGRVVKDVPHARTSDPATSARSGHQTEREEGRTSVLKPGSVKHLALKLISERPGTAVEVERRSGKRGIWKRVSDLKNADLIEPLDTRRDPQTKREGIVWMLSWRGRLALRQLELGEEVRL